MTETRTMNMIQAINSALDVAMDRDATTVILGEDVGFFGGVFKATEGLQKKYGMITACVGGGQGIAGIIENIS